MVLKHSVLAVLLQKSEHYFISNSHTRVLIFKRVLNIDVSSAQVDAAIIYFVCAVAVRNAL